MNKKIQRIIWNPQPRQVLMMSKTEFEALYGGAAGGGKSDYLLAEALRQVHIPQYRAIIFRKTYPELADLISRKQALLEVSVWGDHLFRSDAAYQRQTKIPGPAF